MNLKKIRKRRKEFQKIRNDERKFNESFISKKKTVISEDKEKAKSEKVDQEVHIKNDKDFVYIKKTVQNSQGVFHFKGKMGSKNYDFIRIKQDSKPNSKVSINSRTRRAIKLDYFNTILSNLNITFKQFVKIIFIILHTLIA